MPISSKVIARSIRIFFSYRFEMFRNQPAPKPPARSLGPFNGADL